MSNGQQMVWAVAFVRALEADKLPREAAKLAMTAVLAIDAAIIGLDLTSEALDQQVLSGLDSMQRK